MSGSGSGVSWWDAYDWIGLSHQDTDKPPSYEFYNPHIIEMHRKRYVPRTDWSDRNFMSGLAKDHCISICRIRAETERSKINDFSTLLPFLTSVGFSGITTFLLNKFLGFLNDPNSTKWAKGVMYGKVALALAKLAFYAGLVVAVVLVINAYWDWIDWKFEARSSIATAQIICEAKCVDYWSKHRSGRN